MSLNMNMLPDCDRQPFSLADLPATSSLLDALAELLFAVLAAGVWSLLCAPMSLLGLDVVLVGGLGFGDDDG